MMTMALVGSSEAIPLKPKGGAWPAVPGGGLRERATPSALVRDG